MAYSEGVFTPSKHAELLVAESNFITNSRISELRKPIIAGQAILMHQDPNLTLLGEQKGDGVKCTNAKLTAMRTCNNVVEEDLELDCEVPAGTEAGSESLTLGKDIISIARFTVWDSDCDNVYGFEQKVAQQKAVAKVNIEVDLSKKLVAYAGAQADTPSASWFKTTGTVSGNTYQITEANWNSNLYGDLWQVATKTDIYEPIMLNGTNFNIETFLAAYKGVACCDNDQVLRGAPWDVYFDLKNIDPVLGGEFTLMLDKNSILSWYSVDWVNTVPMLQMADTYTWSEPLPRLTYTANGAAQQIWVDVRARRDCRNGSDYGVHYELILRGEIIANFANCDGRKGILKIEQVAGA